MGRHTRRRRRRRWRNLREPVGMNSSRAGGSATKRRSRGRAGRSLACTVLMRKRARCCRAGSVHGWIIWIELAPSTSRGRWSRRRVLLRSLSPGRFAGWESGVRSGRHAWNRPGHCSSCTAASASWTRGDIRHRGDGVEASVVLVLVCCRSAAVVRLYGPRRTVVTDWCRTVVGHPIGVSVISLIASATSS